MELHVNYPLQESFRLLLLRIAADAAHTHSELIPLVDPSDAHCAALRSLLSLVEMLESILRANELALEVAFCVGISLTEPHNSVNIISTNKVDNGQKT